MNLRKLINLLNKPEDFNFWEYYSVISYSGSYVYSNKKAKSKDIDVIGIYILPKELFFGCMHTKYKYCYCTIQDEWDLNFYEFKNAMALLLKGNFRLIELLFTNMEFIIKTSEEFQLLRINRNLFINEQLYYNIKGYVKKVLKNISKNVLINSELYHIVRLLKWSIELFRDGQFSPVSNDWNKLYNIKNGLNKIDFIKKDIIELEKELDYNFNHSIYKINNYEKNINNLCSTILSNYYAKN